MEEKNRYRAWSSSNEHNKINWKGEFDKYACWLAPGEPTDKKNQLRCIKGTGNILGTLHLWNSNDPDP
jgi:hypothetical protein